MYLRNFLAAASFIAMVASAALPETQGAYVPGFEKSCVEGCKADGTANVRWTPSLLSNHLPASSEPPQENRHANVGCTGELLWMVPSM